jgi:arylsulfatase A-like enzyme
MGWDKAREMILARQIELGIVPPGTRLTDRPKDIPAWDSLSAEQKKLYARQIEALAAQWYPARPPLRPRCAHHVDE